jgi:hypothetical protein
MTIDNTLDARREAKNAKRRAARAAKKAATQSAPVDTGFEPLPWHLRRNTKRFKVFALVNCSEGATLQQGAKATGWGENVVLSEIHEVAKIVGAHVKREGVKYRITR